MLLLWLLTFNWGLIATQEIKMAFYIHIGCELSGRAESTRFVDYWIHMIALSTRLEIIETVLDL